MREIAEKILRDMRKWSTSHGGERERNLRYYDRENRDAAPAVARAYLDSLQEIERLTEENVRLKENR